MMSKSRLVPWLGFGVTLVAVALLWHGGPSRMPIDKSSPPADTASAVAAGADATRLIVDFRDDVSAETLANNGLTEIPISDYSRTDRMYRVEFSNATEAAAALALSNPASRRRLRIVAAFRRADAQELAAPLDGGGMEAECGGAPGSSFPNDACYKYQWHMRQLGMPDAWKRGNGKGVIVAVIDTGVTKVADLAETKFVPGYNFIANNTNADDDHGHGTHVAGTIAQSTNNKRGVAGVAYGATIMPLKVLSARGSGSVAGITQAIRGRPTTAPTSST
jgi:serine protease